MLIPELPKVIGHRGACGYAPENTLASVRKAYELGTKWIEFDVMLTGNSEAIIIHDTTLQRTTNGKGKVADTSCADISHLDAGSWFSSKFAGEKIPTFVEILNYANELDLGINVEIKPTPGYETETAETVIKILRKHWPKTAIPPLVSSFSTRCLEVARSLDANLALGYIIHSWPKQWLEIVQRLNCVSLHVDQRYLTPQKITEVKQQGLLLLAYTINEAELAKRLFELGINAVFSNYPDVIQAALSRSGI